MQGERIDLPWENIDVSDAENTSTGASEPFTVLETYLKNSVKPFGFIQITCVQEKTVGKFASLVEEYITDVSWRTEYLLARTC